MFMARTNPPELASRVRLVDAPFPNATGQAERTIAPNRKERCTVNVKAHIYNERR